jgi:hypothetical protein
MTRRVAACGRGDWQLTSSREAPATRRYIGVASLTLGCAFRVMQPGLGGPAAVFAGRLL